MSIEKKKHHEQQDLCLSRPCYRQGRNLTAVKVYTVSDESTHLLVSNVPSIKLCKELCTLCNRFGDLVFCTVVPNYDDQDKFVETYHIQYSRLQSARFAKKQIDGRNFFGQVLHVCYAPELETVEETRLKLIQRRKEVAVRVRKKDQVSSVVNSTVTRNYVSAKKFSKIPDQGLEFLKTDENQLANQVGLLVIFMYYIVLLTKTEENKLIALSSNGTLRNAFENGKLLDMPQDYKDYIFYM